MGFTLEQKKLTTKEIVSILKDLAVEASGIEHAALTQAIERLEGAEAERKRRQREGIEAAKREGKYNGRKPMDVDKLLFVQLYNEVQNGERTARYAMGQLGVKNTTWYKLVKEYETKMGRFEAM